MIKSLLAAWLILFVYPAISLPIVRYLISTAENVPAAIASVFITQLVVSFATAIIAFLADRRAQRRCANSED